MYLCICIFVSLLEKCQPATDSPKQQEIVPMPSSPGHNHHYAADDDYNDYNDGHFLRVTKAMMTKMVAKDSLRQQGTNTVMLSCPFLLMIMMTELMCFCLRKPPQHLSPPLVGPFKHRCCSWGISP